MIYNQQNNRLFTIKISSFTLPCPEVFFKKNSKFKKMKKTGLLIIILFLGFQLFAQNIFNAKIIDKQSKKPIGYVVVTTKNNINSTIACAQGLFGIKISNSDKELTFSHVAYLTETKTIEGIISNNNIIELTPKSIGLEEAEIISSVAYDRKSAVSVSNVDRKTITKELGNQEFPQILKVIPSTYATREGGGAGDARINIRGFQQENIELLLNGVPVSSVENGLVYWSNWLGLAGATNSIQVQRGLGASQAATNSIGGTINIITRPSETQKGGYITQSLTSYGNKQTGVSFSTGLQKNGWAATFLGSHTTGEGYVDATKVDAWSYFLTLSKQINKNNLLVFTVLGSPERHGQRTNFFTKQEYDNYGNKYNPNWGSYNGKTNMLTENFYHKPQIALNHYLQINKKMFLSTSAYYSFGYGGGKWSESFNYSPSVSTFRNASNQIDWAAIYNNNTTHTDSTTLSDGTKIGGYSKNIQTDFLASHYWTGILSSFKYNISDNLNITAGFHGRYFVSNVKEQITNLLGGKYWVEDYAWSLSGVDNREQIKYVGDYIKVDNGATIQYLQNFIQLNYYTGSLNTFLSSSISGTQYQRRDDYNYTENPKSKKVSKTGYNIKTGVNYNINEKHNIYLNAGIYSKAPYYKFIFVNWSNVVAKDIKNETIKSFELGYGFNNDFLRVKLDAYYTLWKDKSILTKDFVPLEDNTDSRAMIKGLDALHKGVEMEATALITNNLSLGMAASIADWKWQNNVTAQFYDENNQQIAEETIYASGLYVGDAPQTQVALFAKININKQLSLKTNWNYYDKYYANFDPQTRNNPDDTQQPYKIPAYGNLDIHLFYDFVVFGQKTEATVNCYNIANNEHIIRGEDGSSHEIDTFKGFWSFGRSLNFSLKVNF